MILFLYSLPRRLGGAFLSNNDLLKDLAIDFELNRLLIVDRDWLPAELNVIPDVDKARRIRMGMWSPVQRPEPLDLVRLKKALAKYWAVGQVIVFLGHERFHWMLPLLKECGRTPCLIIHHGTPTHSLDTLSEVDRVSFIRNIPLADFHVTVSHHLSRIVESITGVPPITFPNLPDLPGMSGGVIVRTHRTNSVRLLQISTMRPIKRPFDGIELVQQLRQLNIEANITIVGRGELLDEYRNRALLSENPDAFSFVPFASRDTIASLLGSHDILFLPSEKEGLPRVVVEAFLAGCVVLLSTGANECKVIENYINGMVFQTGDLSAAAMRVRDLCLNSTIYSKIIEKGRFTYNSLRRQRLNALDELKDCLKRLSRCERND